MTNSFKTGLLFIFSLTLSSILLAQTPYPMRWSFRLYDNNDQLITPYRFVTEVQFYSLYSYPPFIYRKKLVFDDRTYYYLFQEDKFPEADRFLLIYQQDTMYLEFNHSTGITIMDSIKIRKGHYTLPKTAFKEAEGNLSPFLKESLYLRSSADLEPYKTNELPLHNDQTKALFMDRVRVDLPNKDDIIHGK
ncbi:MAG: hypothetical protein GY810_05775 [Aureispira sp.]|nr:hypothetical protein [Aureispira sp.]